MLTACLVKQYAYRASVIMILIMITIAMMMMTMIDGEKLTTV